MWFWWIKKSELRVVTDPSSCRWTDSGSWDDIALCHQPLSLERILLPKGSVHRCCRWHPLSPGRVDSSLGASVCLLGGTTPLARAMLLELLHGSCSQLGSQLCNCSNSLGGSGWEEANDTVCVVEPALWKRSPPLGLWCLATPTYGDLYYFPELNNVWNKWCLNALYCVPGVGLKAGNQ